MAVDKSMFYNNQITGKSLPYKTLCLSYDDGPGETPGSSTGPQTLKLAEYLWEQEIQATFFVVGKHVQKFPEILPKLSELGHLIGNHTYTHPHLRNCTNVVAELATNYEIIKRYAVGGRTFFRAPWGEWSPDICNVLNADTSIRETHVGPIGWDVDGQDWDEWKNSKTPEECADKYVDEIETRGSKGIILMHDSTADDEEIMRRNNTFEMTKILIPRLKQNRYSFVRLDSIDLNCNLAS